MNNSLFIIVLKYIAPIEKIDIYRADHLRFLDTQYARGTFIVSGTQVPRTGGIIMAKHISKDELKELLKSDPFAINKLAEYQIYEFTPTRQLPLFKVIINK